LTIGKDTAVVVASATDALGWIIFVVLSFGLYYVPTIVAAVRKAPRLGVIVVINVLLGWTLIGWFVALALAFRSRPQKGEADSEEATTPNTEAISASALVHRECPHCEQQMRRDASVCPHCQRDSPPWSKEGDRWWQLHDGPPHYWDEQTQQWREPPLPASTQLVAGSPVSHDAAGERRSGRRLLYLSVAIAAAAVAAAVAAAAFIDSGSNDDAPAVFEPGLANDDAPAVFEPGFVGTDGWRDAKGNTCKDSDASSDKDGLWCPASRSSAPGPKEDSTLTIDRNYRDVNGKTCDEALAHYGDYWPNSGLSSNKIWCPASLPPGWKQPKPIITPGFVGNYDWQDAKGNICKDSAAKPGYRWPGSGLDKNARWCPASVPR
jgi:hypothetical protein